MNMDACGPDILVFVDSYTALCGGKVAEKLVMENS